MPPIPERTIYTLDEAAAHTAQSASYLLNEGALDKLQFFVFVPANIQVMNVDASAQRGQESSDSVMRTLFYDQTPLPTVGLDVLMLSASDCQKILTIGTFAQDAFFSAGKFDERAMIQRVKPEKPPDDQYGIGLRHSWRRHFGAYVRQAASGGWGAKASPERQAIALTVGMLRVSADALSAYMKAQPPIAPAASILVQAFRASLALPSKKKKARSIDEVSQLIKKAYLRVDVEDRSNNKRVWAELINMAKSDKPPAPFLDEVFDGIRYEKSLGVEETLTYRKFLDRLKTIKDNLKQK